MPNAISAAAATTTRPTSTTLETSVLESPLGPMTLVASPTGIRAILWPDDDPARVPSAIASPNNTVETDPPPPSREVTVGFPEATVGSAGPQRAEQGSRRREADGRHATEATRHLEAAATALASYFTDAQTDVGHLDLDLRGTDFQQQVWTALADIDPGTTTTYGDLAARLGRPTAARAIGAAVGRNPVSIVLPCHRVVGASGELTGFAGGLDAKRWLLRHEGAALV